MEQDQWDVVVIGGSAAGLSAGLLLGRSRRRTLIVDAGRARNRFAEHIHGMLGNEGTIPADLLERGQCEAAGYGVEFLRDTVERVDEIEHGLELTLTNGSAIRARAIIVASGLTDELPNIPGLAERWGKTVLHCPYCHGWEVADRRLGVLASGPLSFHQAQLVRQWSDDLTVFTAQLDELEMSDEVRLRSRGIRLVASPIVEIYGEGGGMSGVRTADGARVELDALFIAAVMHPNDTFLEPLPLLRVDTPAGSFLAVDATGKTSGARIWAAGNVSNPAASVAAAVSAGALTGAAVNMFLVTAEFDRAVADPSSWAGVHPSDVE